MTEPSAKVVADSISVDGHRLTTLEVVIHRFCLSEFNTHRVMSRNSASSRAIPFAKQLDRVMDDPALPVSWPAEQRGMQGGEELPDRGLLADVWLDARDAAVRQAKHLSSLGVHKSVVNRLLEPFMWHTIAVTATAWENFFRQRCSPLAQPEIRVAAEAMRAAMEASTPGKLGVGEWHLPYVQDVDREWAASRFEAHGLLRSLDLDATELLVRISVARCARVSYLTQAGVRDPSEDLRLYDRLVTAEPPHASPLEHVATPAAWNVRTGYDSDSLLPVVGNFLGWEQKRLSVELARDYQFYA